MFFVNVLKNPFNNLSLIGSFSQYSDYATDRTTKESRIDSHRGKRVFSPLKCPDQLWG
jgi:hypothetical protein